MGIDSNEVKKFWDSQAQKYNQISFESIGNLEEDPELSKLKMKLEHEKIFSILNITSDMTILDLGAGVGTWSMLFAPNCKKVYAVEYSEGILNLGKAEAKKRGLYNIEFIHQPAQKFTSSIKFDLIFISGLFVFLNDDECEELISQIPAYSRMGTELLLRDGTGIAGRYEIHDRYSEVLKTNYSSIYRTSKTYKEFFTRIGFKLLLDEDMFAPGCPLNKYPETRLRVYFFEKVRRR